MVQLKRTAQTLEELTERADELKAEIKSSQRQLKSITATKKALEKLSADMPAASKRARSKKSAAPAA